MLLRERSIVSKFGILYMNCGTVFSPQLISDIECMFLYVMILLILKLVNDNISTLGSCRWVKFIDILFSLLMCILLSFYS